MRKNVMKRSIFWTLLAIMLMQFSILAHAETVRLDVKSGEDITATLQRVLDKKRYNSGSDVLRVEIPAGSYKINGNGLRIYSNTCLSMKGVTLSHSSAGSTMFLFGRVQEMGTVGGYSQYHDITFEGGVLDGSGYHAQILRGAHARNLKFDGVTFTNVASDHHVELAAVKDVVFTGCTFSKFSGSLAKGQNCEALQFDSIYDGSQFAHYGQWDETPCQNITVTGCKFDSLERGVGTHTAIAGSYFDNINISNNTFTNLKGYAITALHYRNSKINNNTITNCGSGIMVYSLPKNNSRFQTPKSGSFSISKNSKLQVCNNTINVVYKGYESTNFGISLYGKKTKKGEKLPVGNFELEGVTVKNNIITMQSKGYGIWLEGTNKCTIQGNNIEVNIKKGNKTGVGDGIRLVDSESNKLLKNKITNKKKSGLAKEMSGISVIDGSNKNQLKGNVVTNCSKDGIAVKVSKNVTLNGNTVTKSGRYGFNVTDKATAVLSGTNRSTKNGSKALSVSNGAKAKGKVTEK